MKKNIPGRGNTSVLTMGRPSRNWLQSSGRRPHPQSGERRRQIPQVGGTERTGTIRRTSRESVWPHFKAVRQPSHEKAVAREEGRTG